MIRVNKRIIVFDNKGKYMVMCNPIIVKQSGPYEAEEGCLSLTGTRKTKRFQTIKVQWRTRNSRPGARLFPAGRQRSFSTKLTTARGSSYGGHKALYRETESNTLEQSF